MTVIVTLLWLPFGKLFHVFQRPAQLGVSFYKDAGARDRQALCRRCGQPFASAMMVRDLTVGRTASSVSYEMTPHGASLSGDLSAVPPRAVRAGAGRACGGQ